MSSRGVYCDIDRHSCEGRNPENSVLSRLDARLREHDEKITPIHKIDRIPYFDIRYSAVRYSIFAFIFLPSTLHAPHLIFSHEYHSTISSKQPNMIKSIHKGCCADISSETKGAWD